MYQKRYTNQLKVWDNKSRNKLTSAKWFPGAPSTKYRSSESV